MGTFQVCPHLAPHSLRQAVAIAGYMAFGNDVPAYLLTGFDHPRWLITMANIMVVVHMLPAYQVWHGAGSAEE